jgi:hypothetical protein
LRPLTPRAREVVTLVINSAALGSFETDGQLGAVADKIGMTRGRLQALLRRLDGWLAVKNGYLVPTVAALRWQNPAMVEREAAALHRRLTATASHA